MGYLLPTEYVEYGLAAETTDDWVTMASALIEAQCKRPSLLAQEYTEQVRLTAGAQTARLSYGPLLPGALISAVARYARPRRGEMAQGFQAQIATAFGLTFPTNFLGIAYTEAKVSYTAGLVTIPAAVKAACAQIVKNAQATPALNVKASRLDTMQMTYFSGSLIDPQVDMLLRPYVAERLG
jgi:hypothetical protein